MPAAPSLSPLLRAAAAALSLLAGCGHSPVGPTVSGLGVAEVLRGDGDSIAGFARATAPPQLQFPRDHGPHREFRTEWWYVTGNLASDAGRRFGVQLVFFRQALAPQGTAPRAGTLAANEVILAHAAVTDVDGQRFFADEQLVRGAGGLAYVRGAGPEQPFAIACGDWSARARPDGDGFLPLELVASGGDFAFELQVSPGKPVVLQGDQGLSQKSDEPGNASIYYSMPRLPIAGRITVAGAAHAVRGEAWLDREWSTSALGADQLGWDWFSLQLDDGTEVMWYRLRRRDGGSDTWSRGCFVARDGTAIRLEPRQVTATPVGTWRASDGGASYPAAWRLVAQGPVAFELEVTPLVADQELRLLVRYWEGAVGVRGTRDGAPVTGRGYLEMTGYVSPR
ncbi:MAG: carotenoid 1,2-hydratase [Planctomycetes bacterium]|jgi:predicted secreted hydrolase|nr:carotenoid 1,2-hydratase [Planctomycetota bacterium]